MNKMKQIGAAAFAAAILTLTGCGRAVERTEINNRCTGNRAIHNGRNACSYHRDCTCHYRNDHSRYRNRAGNGTRNARTYHGNRRSRGRNSDKCRFVR